MLHSCTHTATVGVKGLIILLLSTNTTTIVSYILNVWQFSSLLSNSSIYPSSFQTAAQDYNSFIVALAIKALMIH